MPLDGSRILRLLQIPSESHPFEVATAAGMADIAPLVPA